MRKDIEYTSWEDFVTGMKTSSTT